MQQRLVAFIKSAMVKSLPDYAKSAFNIGQTLLLGIFAAYLSGKFSVELVAILIIGSVMYYVVGTALRGLSEDDSE